MCETKCTVGAIDALGRINPNECVLCLRCQVIMNDGAMPGAETPGAGRGGGMTALSRLFSKASASSSLRPASLRCCR
jgi:dissimilatory sulfite reductase (desulfoviridin) alpha/beta subunit